MKKINLNNMQYNFKKKKRERDFILFKIKSLSPK